MNLRARLAPATRQAVKAAAAAADLPTRDRGGTTILIYHRVGAGNGGEMDLDPPTFEAQLSWLRANHRVLSLDEATAELVAPVDPRDERPAVVLTFDDGTADWVDHVLPMLERHRVPATFYVATDFVEGGTPIPGDGTPISWAGLAELAASPLVTLGSHTHRHLLLDRLPPDQIGDELDRSTDLLGERVGVTAEHFCYPKAVAGSAAAEGAVRARFRTAVLAGTRPNRTGADLHRLHRSPVQRSDGVRWFRHKAAGGMRLEDDLRRGLNRIRYRGRTS